MTSAEFGNLTPREVIQEDTRACLSACILSQLPEDSGITEADVSEVLISDGLYAEGGGAALRAAGTLDTSLRQLGLAVSPVYDARLQDQDTTEAILAGRLSRIDKAVRAGQSVILAFPKRREGQAPFLHYAVVTGFSESDDGATITVLDPSDIDGGVRHLTTDELVEYVTPEEHDYPVMAWGIRPAKYEARAQLPEKIQEDGLPGFSLLAKPISDEDSIGLSIPTGTNHPSSVSMPTSSITRQFAELGGVVLSRDGQDPTGYPRFVVPPVVRQLSLDTTGRLCDLPFPTRKSAVAAIHPERTYSMHQQDAKDTEIVERNGLYWIRDTELSNGAWQHTGLGVSSRQAQSILEGRPENNLQRLGVAERHIKYVIESHTGAKPEDIYLFPTGMAAIYWLNQALIKAYDKAPSAQFGFPYADSFEQRKYGPNRGIKSNILDLRGGDYDQLRDLVNSGEQLRGVMTEYPSNPLLWTPDLEQMDGILGDNAPIIIDDTIGTMFNLDDKKLPDGVAARVTSLTKFFSSVGDVMGGSIILRPDSPHYEKLKAALEELYEDTLWYEDAEVLAHNSNLFPTVMPKINQSGSELTEWLHEEWVGKSNALEAVYHPSQNSTAEYDAVKKERGGYGGLFTMRFNEAQRAYKFFDALRVTKGPSLGAYYTLGCLYTWLAHKESVEKFGVTPDLVRISTGIEDIQQLKDRFTEAFEQSSQRD